MSEILVNTIKKADGTGSLTVPADTGTVLTSATALSNFPSGFKNGITAADQWRLTSAYTVNSASATAIDLYWEQSDEPTFSALGSSMTESSGIFTFPETGLWQVFLQGRFRLVSGADYLFLQNMISSDGGSTYATQADPIQGSEGGRYNTVYSQILVNVTGTASNYKFYLRAQASGGTGHLVQGDTASNLTSLVFVRLGDAV